MGFFKKIDIFFVFFVFTCYGCYYCFNKVFIEQMKVNEESVKSMKTYLEDNPKVVYEFQNHTPFPTANSQENIHSFFQDLDTEEGKKKIIQSNGYFYHNLVKKILFGFDHLADDQVDDRLYLLSVSNRLNQLSHSDEIQSSLLEQAKKYQNSENRKLKEFSELSFLLYLKMEKNESRKAVNYAYFYGY